MQTAALCAHWLHNGFLTIDNEKMSKSKGNFFMVRDAAKQFGYETIRMFMLSAHYRTPLNYSAESLEMNKASPGSSYEARNTRSSASKRHPATP